MARKTIKTLTTTALLALGALAGGCGGDDSPSEHAGEAEPQKAQKSDAAKPNAADDRLAKASLLALRDFPTGWAAEDDDETSSKFNCPAVRELRARSTGKATAPTFAMGNDVTKVFHSVAVFEGPQEAASAYAGIATAETRRCLGKEIAKVFADSLERDGGKVGEVKTSAVRVPSVGDQVDASRYTVDVTCRGLVRALT